MSNRYWLGGAAVALGVATTSMLMLRRQLNAGSKPSRLSPSDPAHRKWAQDMKAFIFDIDGVIYTGSGPILGAAEALVALRAAGKTVRFMTNNATKTPDDVVAAFAKVGAVIHPEEVMTSALAAGSYLEGQGLRGKTVYVAGMSALAVALSDLAGVVTFGGNDDGEKTRADVLKEFVPTMTPSPETVAAVVVGADFNYNYYKITRAVNYLKQNPSCLFVSTNPDPTALLGNGIVVPAGGAMAAAIAYASGRRPDIVCGKPSESLARLLLDRWGMSPATTCMVGDRTDTDIEFGRSVGMQTLFVESGTMSASDAINAPPERRPHFIAPSIAELGQLF